MKFSLNLASYYSQQNNTGNDPKGYDPEELVQKIGLQLGAIEDVEFFAPKYKGIVVAKIVSCEKHPNADNLKLCMIDDGSVNAEVVRDANRLVQVVCGAPNVEAGQTVAWIPPGSTVPSSVNKEPFVLEARELRGKVSNGMIASPKELALSDDHEGILVIQQDDVGEDLMIPGTPFSKLYGLDDVVIDCENKMFTHRPDCFGNMGIAREISGIFGDKYSSPDWYKNPVSNEITAKLDLSTKNEIFDKVPRFVVQAIEDVEVKPSPMWLQSYLKRIGQKSINNIVDYTNYFMMLTGQPLHAFDYDKVAEKCGDSGVSIFPRLAKKGEKLRLLNGKEIELSEEDIVISTDKEAIALGGVMGGAETEVDENTRSIIVECANFDMFTIRRTSMRHGLFTDAVTRFNKGQSPLQNIQVISKMVNEVVENAFGKVASEVLDVAGFDKDVDNLSHATVSVDFINSRLGSDLAAEEVKTLLENVEFSVEIDEKNLNITVPFWRMDIVIGEDIVEEVGRLYGYFNLPVELPARDSRPTQSNKIRKFRSELRDSLVAAGANEVLTYSFVHGDLMRNTGTDPEKWAYHLRNALSPDLQYYRTSLVPSLLNKLHSNIKAQAGDSDNEFALFEFGKAHVKGHQEEDEPELPGQMNRLALVVAADDKSAKKHFGSAYYLAKKYLDMVTKGQAIFEALEDSQYPMTAVYQKGRSATVKLNGEVLGVIGEFNSKARRALKLPKYCAGFELDTDMLMSDLKELNYKPLSTFPSLLQDITFEVSENMNWSRINDFVHAELAVAKAETGYLYELEPLDIFQVEDSGKKRLSMRISLSHSQKTLKTAEVNKLLDQIAKVADDKLQATRI